MKYSQMRYSQKKYSQMKRALWARHTNDGKEVITEQLLGLDIKLLDCS